jgi:hypothetical protein
VDRDVLLVLLVGGCLLNLGLLLLVALMRAAPWRHAADLGVGASPSLRTVAARGPMAHRPGTSRTASRGAMDGSLATTAALAGRTPSPSPSSPGPGPDPEGASPGAASRVAEPVIAVPSAPAPLDAASLAPPRPGASAPAPRSRAAEAASRRTTPRAAGIRRPRRFTMPDLEEDSERSARSIAAFLGEPTAPAAGTRPHRRRHRTRRPAGAAVKTDVVLVLHGEPLPARAPRAVAAALRGAVRESDEVVELDGGRLRVSLDADPAGSEVFIARARSVVRPWLELLGPTVDLRIDGEPRRSPAASATR